MPEQITSYCPSCHWTGLVTVGTGSCPVCHAPLQTVINLPPGRAPSASQRTMKKVYYVGSDRVLVQLLRELFAARGYALEQGERLPVGALKTDLLLVDKRLLNWMVITYNFGFLGLIPVWIVVDLPQSLGEEQNLAREIKVAGALTYLRRLNDEAVLGEDLDVALSVTFPPASVAAPDQKWTQARLL